jgi:type I restriction enzyme R subunit
MPSQTDERAFEQAIAAQLTTYGRYEPGLPSEYEAALGFFPATILRFIQKTQQEAWAKLSEIHGEQVRTKFFQRLFKELDNRGMLDVLRHGITDYGVRFSLAYFKPATQLNPETRERYEQNILTVTRQVHFSTQDPMKSVDLVLALNGLPVATVELKNAFTGQDVGNAKRQYATSRDPKELLFQFKKRALVHFAVDTEEAWMTTRIDGKQTRYLPFNKGYGKGAGNPPNARGHKTAYLWDEVWARDSWLEVIGKFINVERREETFLGQTVKSEKIVFPRYHQLDVVRKLVDDAYRQGPGHNYLIQHSAGSGKSNSIAWLAYRLSSLHDTADQRVFDSVIVVTDRRVLDSQLQDTIYQFEHTSGVVQKIDDDSTQLAAALERGTNIIITTLQKFPFVLGKIGQLPKRNYALIVDEAHSSQGGEASTKMKQVLTVIDMEKKLKEEQSTYGNGEEEDVQDGIRNTMLARGPQPNLSFFAFTATPKAKTLQVFGTPGVDGLPEPFHLYSMRQAIEEGFILDVLQNYTTYKTYFRLSKAIEDDPQLNKKKAARAIARYVSFHPYNLAQKTEVIIEHFRQCVMPKIGGKAKAMVVTASRPHVIRYKEAFDTYLAEKGYTDIRALVAFTAFTDSETGIAYRESEINGFSESELPRRFGSPEYALLIVAEKYQTGFDQPLLHTMYVDKKLSGVRAVQTLSRLNRVHPGKEETFVLDFVNEEEDILASFQPYYEKTSLTGTTDPNKLYDLKSEIEGYQIIWPAEVDAFARVFFKSAARHTRQDHGRLNSAIDPAVDRFNALSEEQQDDCRNACGVFVRLYAFLAQIMPFSDVELEKLYVYLRFLLTKLPRDGQGAALHLDDEVALEYYRLQKVREGSVELERDGEAPLDPLSEAGMRQEKEIQARLSEIIDLLNTRFGTDFTDADKLFFEQIEEELVRDDTLGQQARNNSIDNFRYGFDEVFLEKLIGRMEDNQEIFARILDDEEFGTLVRDWMLRKVYQRLNKEPGQLETEIAT